MRLLSSFWLLLASSTAFAFRPWWEDTSIRWEKVDPDLNWDGRRTGVTTEWKAGLSMWKHYNATNMQKPWTSGRMVKSLKLLNDTAFSLHSVYEPAATGLWFKGGLQTRMDGLVQHGHIFMKTPYRVTTLPGLVMPEDLMEVEAATSSQVTLVKPDGATFSGPRWLPSVAQAKDLLEFPGAARWQFCEMWLAETVDGQAEAVKMGFFCQYDGVTGDLLQAFTMREVALTIEQSPKNPDDPIDFDQLQAGAPLWNKTNHLETPVAKALLNGEPLDVVLAKGGWNTYSARIVRSPSLLGPEEAIEITDEPARSMWQTVEQGDDGVYDCRWEDGRYIRIPKLLSPGRENVCFEFGCLATSGDFHRVLALGSRSAGGLRTTCYERWSRKDEAPEVESATEAVETEEGDKGDMTHLD